MELSELSRQLKNGELKNLYFLYGEEDYLKDSFCRQIVSRTVDPALGSFNLQVFNDENFSVPQFAAAVGNMPLMSKKKCVLLKGVNFKDLKTGEWSEFQALLKELPEDCILIVLGPAKKQFKDDERWKALLPIARKSGLAVELGRLKRPELRKWVNREVRRSGASISSDAVDYFIDICGNDLFRLQSELDKICAYAAGREINRKDIDALAIKPLDATIYDLARNMTWGNLDKSLRTIGELFDKKEKPVMILSALSGAFCDLYRAKAALASGAGEKELMNDFNYRSTAFRVPNALRDSRNLPLSFLAESLGLLMEADGKIKGSQADERVALEQLVIEIGRARKESLKVDSH